MTRRRVYLLFGENEHTEDEPHIVVFESRATAERYGDAHYTGWNVEEYDLHPDAPDRAVAATTL